MIDPKYSVQILRPEVQASQSSLFDDDQNEDDSDVVGPLIEHDEPDNPIHPELEYEVLHAGEDSSSGYLPAPPPTMLTSWRRKRTLKNDAKLLVSFICLVIFG